MNCLLLKNVKHYFTSGFTFTNHLIVKPIMKKYKLKFN